jgi:outer membrane protein OmpA-like peptidoglycan-associated protein
MTNLLNPLNNNLSSNQEAQWISLSDLMTGLMMMFMLIAVSYMVMVEEKNSKIKQVVILYDKTKKELYSDLHSEFKKDLENWGAELHDDLTLSFQEPEVLFDTGSDNLKPKFKNILKDFFPRYVKIITSEKYKNAIQEIRIEGHTSSFWNLETQKDEAYFKNMQLSQSRTRTTLSYLFNIPSIKNNIEWLRKYVTANGLSSSRIILNEDGTENANKSQRVEFRVRTDAESRIATIIESM